MKWVYWDQVIENNFDDIWYYLLGEGRPPTYKKEHRKSLRLVKKRKKENMDKFQKRLEEELKRNQEELEKEWEELEKEREAERIANEHKNKKRSLKALERGDIVWYKTKPELGKGEIIERRVSERNGKEVVRYQIWFEDHSRMIRLPHFYISRHKPKIKKQEVLQKGREIE